ncbi:MAG TPA: DUF4340 domain-containing protein [Candidatus Binatia bacterium]|nr:DUF4340 domain-containing protein [Candidatus Binatia bacterium]
MAIRRGTFNLVLLGVAGALGVAVWLGQKKDETGPPLTPLKSGDVTKIVLEHPRAAAIRLEKQDGRWRLTAPVAVDAEVLEVSSLTALAERDTKEKLERAQLSLAELKLDPPEYSLTLNDVKLDFGMVEPLQYRRYVKRGDEVFLLEDPPTAALDADYSDLVAKNLLPEGAEIARVELPKLALVRAADARGWQLSPADPKAGADQLQKMADAWRTARAMWNEMPKDVAALKGERVRVVLKDGSAREFVVTQRDPQFQLYRADLGVVYTLSKALQDEMLKVPEPPPADKKPEAAGTAPAKPAPEAAPPGK